MANISSNLSFTLPDTGEFPGGWGVVVNNNFSVLDALFGLAGHGHSGVAGDGPQIDHDTLTNIGVNSHTDVDDHIADNALHANDSVGTVRPALPLDGDTALNVNTIIFENSTVTENSSGVVTVTPQVSSFEESLHVKPISASVAWTDNFNYVSGTLLTQECWMVASSGETDPTYVAAGAANQPGSAVNLVIPLASNERSGGVISHAKACIPHGTAQRVTLVVDKVIGSDTGNQLHVNDELVITLDLLSTTTYGGTGKPNKNGISLVMTKAAGSTTVSYEVSIQPGEAGTEIIFNDFGASLGSSFSSAYGAAFQDLPATFLTGIHEFSMSRVEDNDTDFYLNYYYNGGLVFRKLFNVDSTDNTVAAFADALPDLLTLLATNNEPAYGRIGWGTAYIIGIDRQLTVTVACVTVGSQDDLTALRATTFPDAGTVTPDELCCQGSVSSEFQSLGVGDLFDFDGPLVGGTGDWTITGLIADGEQGSNNGEGFYVQNNGTGEVEVVWCELPDVPVGTANLSTLNSAVLLAVKGANMLMGAADITLGSYTEKQLLVEFLYGTDTYPTNPQKPDGTFHADGDAVATTTAYVVGGDSVTSPGVFYNTDGNAEYKLAFGTAAPLLPWGQTFDVRLTPKYLTTADYSVTIPDAVTIVPRNPFIPPAGVPLPAVTVEYYDTSGTVPEWRSAFLSDSFVQEGSFIYVAFGGVDLPLGQGYWDVANVSDTPSWDMSDANDPVKNPTHLAVPYSFVPSTVTYVDSKFFVGVSSDDYNPTKSGVVPNLVFDQPLTVDGKLVVASGLFQLSSDQWSDASKGFYITVNNPVTGATWVTFPVINGDQVVPRPPAFSGSAEITLTGTSTVTPLIKELAVDVEFTVRSLDDDVEIELGSGWATPGVVDSGSIMVVAASADRFVVTVINQTLDAYAHDTPVELTVRNVAAEASYGSDHEITLSLGILEPSGGGTPVDPPAWQFGSVADLSQNVETVFSLVATDVLPGAVIAFESDGSESDFFKFAGTPVFDGVDTWDFTAYAIDPPSLAFPATGTLYVINQDGQSDGLVFNTTTDVVPALISVEVGSIGGGSEWDISTGTNKVLFFTTTDAITVGGTELPSFAESTDLVTATGPVTQLSPTEFSQPFQINGAGDGDSATFIMYKAVYPGNEGMTDTLVSALDFIDPINVGSGTGGGLNGGGTLNLTAGSRNGSELFAASTGTLDAVPTGDSNPASSDSSGVYFNSTPKEGHYTSFTISGKFYPADGVGSNYTIVLEDESSTPIATSVVIRAATTTQLIGSALMLSDLEGVVIVVRVTDTTRTETVVRNTGVRVTAPPPPRIRSVVLSNPTAGATNVFLEVYGSNLQPPSPPLGQSALNYVYSAVDSGTDTILTSVLLLVSSRELMRFRVSINPVTGGDTLGLSINYLGGNIANFNNVATIESVSAGTPSITNVLLYGEKANPDASPAAPTVVSGGTALLRIQGTGLSSLNVDPGGVGDPASSVGIALEVVGQEGAAHAISSGNGLSANLAEDRILVINLISQTDTEIICRVPATPEWANARARVILSSPEYHTLGAAEWDVATIDGTGLGAVDGVADYGTTVLWGDITRSPKVNVDPTQGDTQLDVARDLQSQLGPGTEGDPFSIDVRLAEAWTATAAPTVLSIADPVYGCQLADIVVTKTASAFVIQVQGTIPDPGVGNSYPLGAFIDSTPARVGLTLSNGVPIAAALLGSADWGDDGTGIAY